MASSCRERARAVKSPESSTSMRWRKTAISSSPSLRQIATLPFLLVVAITLFSLTSALTASSRERFIDALDDASLNTIVNLRPEPWKSVDEGHLGRLLIPRASGSQNNTDVRLYIKSVLDNLNWHTEEDTFTGDTPIGPITFTNLIATFNPDAPTKLVLAAHFDSKWFDGFPANQFIGATDSAAPCSTLLDIAESLTPLLKAKDELVNHAEYEGDEEWAYTTLQLVFFDGEEAFHDWTAKDSIYGARNLAAKWEETYLPDTHPYHSSYLHSRRYDPLPTILSTMEHLVLLDLLGAPNPRISSFYQETAWLHRHLREIEGRVNGLDLRGKGWGIKGGEEWFTTVGYGGRIEDDHIPFLHRGVSVLHLIPAPFPRVWHTLADDASALDMPTLRRWNIIMRIFVVEYLGLPISGSGEYARDLDGEKGRRNGDELTWEDSDPKAGKWCIVPGRAGIAI